MKKHLLSYLFLSTSLLVFAQKGNVGINTKNPQERLHVKGKIRFEATDPNYLPTANKTLVSDNLGNATWQNINLSKPSILAKFNQTAYTKTETFDSYPFTVRRSNARNTGTTLTLPKGKWLVVASIGVYVQNKKTTEVNYYPLQDGRNIWIRASFYDDNSDNITPTPTADIVTNAVFSSTSIIGPNPSGLITGEFFINQTSDTPKTYFLKYHYDYFSPIASNVQIVNFGVTQELVPENFIIAYPMNF